MLWSLGWMRVAFSATLVALFAIPSVAQAAFPGGAGRLAVEPLHGPGVVLVAANGRGRTLLCGPGSACRFGPGARPSWSPDGRSLLLSTGGGVSVVYPDGSCLDCQAFPDSESQTPGMGAFTNQPMMTTVTLAGNLVEYGVDGVVKRTLVGGGVTDAEWSSHGRLALVRHNTVWVGNPGSLRRLGPGSDPAWSPNGQQIAFTRQGWIVVGRPAARSWKRLALGSAPAWSPNGSTIAFIGKRHQVSLISPHGGRFRALGTVKGKAIDWQPLTTAPPPSCTAPPGSKVMTSNQTAIVTSDLGPNEPPFPAQLTGNAYMGCLRGDGRPRLLARYKSADELTFPESAAEAATAGNYAALTHAQSGHDQPSSEQVGVFDLRTGSAVSRLGGERFSCDNSCAGTMDSLVINDQGFTAVRVKLYQNTVSEQILASDNSGSRTVDSAASSSNTDVLSALALAGDTLSWKHNGTPESAQLH